VGFRATRHVVHRSPLSRFRVKVHVATPDPFLSGRRDLEPLDT
jgi:hypothetical protein